MKRRVTVQGKHLMLQVWQSSDGEWIASGELEGRTFEVSGKTANRAASDWAASVPFAVETQG